MGKENAKNFIIYKGPAGDISVSAYIKDETIWLTQKEMAELFGCSTDNISLHLKKIFDEGELDLEATAEKFSVVQKEGSREVKRTVLFYNLESDFDKAIKAITQKKPLK